MFSFSKIKYQTFIYIQNKQKPPFLFGCVAGKSKATWSNFNYKCLLIMNIWLWFCLGHILCILFVVGKHSNSLYVSLFSTKLRVCTPVKIKYEWNMWASLVICLFNAFSYSIRNNNNNNDNNRTEPRDAFNVKYDYIQNDTHNDKCMCVMQEKRDDCLYQQH